MQKLYFEDDEITPNNNVNLYFDVTNDSSEEIKELNIKVDNDGENVIERTVSCNIAPYTTEELKIEYKPFLSFKDFAIKYFSLAYPIIDALDNGTRLIIDEFDSKMHPLLTSKIISLFNSAETNRKNAQLIFTSHDTNLLNVGLFRRDQVWFTQKDTYGATELYSLVEYKVRNTAPYEKEYLMGKYGAVPMVGQFERLFDINKNVEDGKEE